MRGLAVTISLLVLMGACQSGRAVPRPAGADQYLIVAEELKASPQPNLYDAVRQLRPSWFSRQTARRGNTEEEILVYIDDRLSGGTSSLRRFPTDYPASVRYLSATEAQLRFGQQNQMRAAILLETPRQ